MTETGLLQGRNLVFCYILSLIVALSQGSPALVIVNDTGSFTYVANTTYEIRFFLQDPPHVTYFIFINHRTFGGNVSLLKCYLMNIGESCTSDNKYCDCVNEETSHQYRLKKSFQIDDSGTWNFTFMGKGFSDTKTINITVIPPEVDSATVVTETSKGSINGENNSRGSFPLTAAATTTHFVTKAETDAGVMQPSTNLSFCPHKMAQTGSFQGQNPAFCQILSLFVALSQGSPALVIVNDTGSFTYVANTTSEIRFFLQDPPAEPYTIFINHKALGGNVSRLKCYLRKTGKNCTSDNENCECVKEETGHQYKLKKSFEKDDSGTWIFKFLGKGLSYNKTINITVVSPEEDLTTVISETLTELTDNTPISRGNSSQGTFSLTAPTTTHQTAATAQTSLPDADSSRHRWLVTLIVVATCLVVVLFGFVVACATWRCAYIHLERRNSDRLACLAGVEMTDSHLRLTMEPVYDTIPALSRRFRVATAKGKSHRRNSDDNS